MASPVTNRVCAWNNARYEQEYNHELTYNLLNEELEELFESKVEVDKLDALCDIVYVAVGAMWKMGLSPDQVDQALLVVCDSNDSKAVKRTASDVKANIDKGKDFVRPEPRLQEILNER